MEVVGAKPRPRALILGFGDAAESLGSLFPTFKALEGWVNVQQSEWDILVTSAGVPPDLQPHIFVLAFGGSDLGEPESRDGMRWGDSVVSAQFQTYATEFTIPDALPRHIRMAVLEGMLPAVRQRSLNFFIAERERRRSEAGNAPGALEPFLLDSDARPIAGRFRRQGGAAECIIVPPGSHNAIVVTAVLKEWQGVDPGRFPRPAEWVSRVEWRTDAELAAQSQLDEIATRRQRLLAELQEEESKAAEHLEEAVRMASEGERRLLTAQGDELVLAVAEALDELGFDCVNMDNVFPATDRREDLRVNCADRPDWVALAEVRGYRGGATIGDLLRLGRFVRRFAADQGRDPDAQWYVVNQFIEDDPRERPPVLASNPAELSAFSEDGGLALDTSELFRLVMKVRRSMMTAEQARALLMDTRGRWAMPD